MCDSFLISFYAISLIHSREEFYRDAEIESKRFTKAMEEYEREVNKKKGKTPLIGQEALSWDDVLKELDVASTQYKDPKGKWGKMRLRFRQLSTKAESASAWVQLLPTQSDYFSILCGGLKLIFGVCYTNFSVQHS